MLNDKDKPVRHQGIGIGLGFQTASDTSKQAAEFLRLLQRSIGIGGQNGEMPHFAPFPRGFFAVKVQVRIRMALQRQPIRFTAVFLPNVAQNIRHAT